MTNQDRVKAVVEFGFTERQARFLVTVMLHSGACLLRQYTTFAGIVHGQKTRKFFRKLVRSSDIRMFPDKVPIGLDLTGRWVIVYLADDAELDPYRGFLQRHADLLAVLAAWTLRIVAPPGLETLGERCQTLVKEELASPVRREVADRLKWYFEQRRAHELEGARLEDEETYYLSRAGFRAPRFQVLYKRWSREGNAALDYATSPAIADAIERGSGRVECVVLPHQYRHLSPVLSAARGARKGADEGEHTPPQPRPQVSPLNPPFNAIRDDRLKTSPSSCQSLVP